MDCIFDANNHLINYNDGAFTAGYRPDGLRGWTRDAGVGLGGKTFYLYDGETLVTEIPPEGEGGARVVVWGANGLISRDNTFYLFDPLGNVAYRLLPNGAIANSSVYDAYGTVTTCAIIAGQLTVIDALDPYQYKGQYGYYTDTATGLVLCTYRYYDPQLGRWLTRDPIGYDGGMNQYGYCGGDPVNEEDSIGLLSQADYDFIHNSWNDQLMGMIDPLYWFHKKPSDPRRVGSEKVGRIFAVTALSMGALGGAEGRLAQKATIVKTAISSKPVIDPVGSVVNKIDIGSGSSGYGDLTNVKIPENLPRYKRPTGATTTAQRASVQGQPCHECGRMTPAQYADHIIPLVDEYYETGTIDLTRMRDINSVLPHCRTCSCRQGGFLCRKYQR